MTEITHGYIPADRICRHPQDAEGIALDMALYGNVYQELNPSQIFTEEFFELMSPTVVRDAFNRYYTERDRT